MSNFRTRFLLAVSLLIAGAAPALAESPRYATDPDAFVWSQLGREHLSLAHADAVLPRTTLTQAARSVAVRSAAYATDPDQKNYVQLEREHLALSHTDAVLPHTRMGAANVAARAVSATATDPDIRIKSMIARERNVD